MLRRLAQVTLIAGGACASAPPPSPAAFAPPATGDLCDRAVTLYAWQDLPRDDPRTHGLSAVAWDQQAKVLRAAGDKTPAVQTLVPDADFRRFTLGEPISVDLGEEWDVEGLAVGADRFYLGNEAGPSVHVVRRDGGHAGRVPLPDSFARARFNHGLESLTLTPDGGTLLVANEHAFTDDGPEADATRGTVVRLTRIDLARGTASQRPYTTDPVPSDAPRGRLGVVDVMAPSAETLYVTERSFVPGAGNSVRIYCLDRSPDKRLLVDLATLPDGDLPEALAPQANRILENFEGFTLGPTLPDGRQLVFGVSDDNGSPKQTPRLIVLALSPR